MSQDTDALREALDRVRGSICDSSTEYGDGMFGTISQRDFDLIDAALSTAPAPERRDEWQPIEAAPRDGTAIWLCWDDGPNLWNVNKAAWDYLHEFLEFAWRFLDDLGDGVWNAPEFLWQPYYKLPDRPEPPALRTTMAPAEGGEA